VQLLVVVVHREDVLDDVLSALVEVEAPDAVVIESRSGLELLERDLPIFAGLRSLVPSGIDFSAVILCSIEDDRHAEEALAAICSLEPAGPVGAAELRNTALLLPVTRLEVF
jgi:hypothetical protein